MSRFAFTLKTEQSVDAAFAGGCDITPSAIASDYAGALLAFMGS